MFLLKLWNYIIGYVRIQVEGFYIERFINLCAAKSVKLWGVDRRKSSLLCANVSIDNFRKIKKIARITKCTVHIIKKRGTPFIIKRYRKRKIFLFSFLTIFVMVLVISTFIWNVEITGKTNIPKQELIEQLKNLGLYTSRWKPKLDTNSIEDKIRLYRDDIAFISINIKGTNAIVEVVDRKETPEMLDNNQICNIISDKKEAYITRMVVIEGTALKQEGDIVLEGEILVEGKIEGQYTGIRDVHARAEIEAKVWYTETEKMDLKQLVRKETGKIHKRNTISFNNFKINLLKSGTNFLSYDTIITEKKLRLFSNIYLPISIITTEFIEIQEEEVIYAKEEAKRICIENIQKKLDEDLEGFSVINRTVNIIDNEGYIEVEMTYETLENIGVKQAVN